MNQSGEKKRQINIVVVGVVYFFLFAVAIGMDRKYYLFQFPKLGENFIAVLLRDVGVGMLAGMLVVGVTRALVRWKKSFRVLAREFHELLGPLKMHEVFFIATFSSISEEFFFRGFVQAKAGLVIASLLFGLLHIGPDKRFLPWTAFAVLLGFFMGGALPLVWKFVGPGCGSLHNQFHQSSLSSPMGRRSFP